MSEAVISSEAEIVALLAPLTAGASGAFGLRDDCAELAPRPGYTFVLKVDPVRAGVHFFPDDPPDAIAWKALAVGVSDLAAKGAVPVAYLMAISFPEAPARSWVAAFVRGLAAAQAEFGCTLVGGDTDRAAGPLSIAITVIGEVRREAMVRRDTAQSGDAIVVSGSLGEAGLGLMLHGRRRGGQAMPTGISDSEIDALIARYLRPRPRLDLSGAVRDCASAAMDVSDGLVKDLTRMCVSSGVGAAVEFDRVPVSDALCRVLASTSDDPAQAKAQAISAGDDYEILAAVPQAKVPSLPPTFHVIGAFVQGEGVTVRRHGGSIVVFDRAGWDHF